MADTMELEIFRYQPDKESEPSFQTYEVPFHEDWVVLDAINHICLLYTSPSPRDRG